MSNQLRIREILRLGTDAQRAGKTQEAIRNYFAILRLDPENLEANHNLGLLHANIGKPEQAASFFKNALLYHPKTEQIWINLVETLISTNKIQQAKKSILDATTNGIQNERFDFLLNRPDAVIFKDSINANVKGYFESAKLEILNYAAFGWLYNIAFDWEYLKYSSQKLTFSSGKKKKIVKETFNQSTRRLQTIEFSKVIEDINKINSPLERLKKLEQINNDCSILGDSFTKQKNIQLTTAQEKSFKPGELNIIIIGSGPCGLYLANALKFNLRKKINILIIDNKCKDKHFKQPFSRRWLSHLPTECFEPYFEPSFYELISGFGRNGFVGLPINMIELILFFSAKSLGVQFYFDRYFDLSKLNPDLITFAVDASGGRLDDELKTKNTYRQEIIELKHQFLDLGYAGVSQLSSSPIVEQGQVNIKLKELGRYYYPYLNENPIRLPMIKLTSIPMEVKSDVLDFIQKNNQKNQFYLWEGDLINELNELLVIINLTENEYTQLISQITKTLLLHDFMRIFENQKSQISLELFTFLNKLDELDKKNQIFIEKPFITKPSINLSPTTQSINGIHVYPFGDSLLTGNPKVGNALGSNLPFISDFVSYITRLI